VNLLDQADAAVALGEFAQASQLLETALAEQDNFAIWCKLAGVRRALRQPRRALEAIQRALVHAPLDFVALSLRAALLESLDPGTAGPAWADALAQRPAGALPPGMDQAIARGEVLRDAWMTAREARMSAALDPLEPSADEDELWKLRRFQSNALRRTRAWHSEPTHYHYPGLTEREFHPRHRFPWLAELEAATGVIRQEMQAALASSRAELVPYLEYQDYEALAQWRDLNRNPDWTAFHLIKLGEVIAANADLCPRTMELIQKIPQPQIPGASPNVMFSLLAPHTVIPPHVGVNNSRLVCHLPLVVPDGCWFRVGAETRLWREGEAFVFDDTIEHEANNPSDLLRVVMIFDVWHPDLSLDEQQGIAAIVGAEGAPVASL
jgi:aspartyl/asparaginyl beta-hydroxylase (cupin superfamily)